MDADDEEGELLETFLRMWHLYRSGDVLAEQEDAVVGAALERLWMRKRKNSVYIGRYVVRVRLGRDIFSSRGRVLFSSHVDR